MHTELLVFLLIIIAIILVFSLVYATSATTGIASAKADPNIYSAYWYLAWTVSILWIIIAGMIIGIVCLFIFGPEFIPVFGKTLLYAVVVILGLALVVTGVMASIGAYYIGISAVESTVTQAYHDAVIAATTALGSIAFAVIIALLVWHYSTPAVPPDQTDSDNSSIIDIPDDLPATDYAAMAM